MNEGLPPKEIARIKREHRESMVSHLRKLVATLTVMLLVLFSGVILARTLGDQNPSALAATTGLSQPVDSGSDDDDEESEDDDDSGILSDVARGITSAVTSTDTSAPPAPDPVTTSQS
ncbi:MAG: hypothetical protein ACSLFD_02220 [Solirubrobacterales bacterium]